MEVLGTLMATYLSLHLNLDKDEEFKRYIAEGKGIKYKLRSNDCNSDFLELIKCQEEKDTIIVDKVRPL